MACATPNKSSLHTQFLHLSYTLEMRNMLFNIYTASNRSCKLANVNLERSQKGKLPWREINGCIRPWYAALIHCYKSLRCICFRLRLCGHIVSTCHSRARPKFTSASPACRDMRLSLTAMASAASSAASPQTRRVLIVGGGPTAALAAAAIREQAAAAHEALHVTIMDKARGLGGRMSTHRASGAGAGAHSDSGAQYLTQLSPASKTWFDRLRAAGVITPLAGSIAGQRGEQRALPSFVAPAGISSVVKHIAATSGATFLPLHRVVGLDLVDAPEEEQGHDERAAAASEKPEIEVGDESAAMPRNRRQWAVRYELVTPEAVARAKAAEEAATAAAAAAASSASKDGAASAPAVAVGAAGSAASHSVIESQRYDAVVLTCPVPQVLALDGDLPALLDGAGVSDGLKAVTYSSRYSLLLYFGPGDWRAVCRQLPSIGRYVDRAEDDVVRYVSFDSLKRGRVPTELLPAGSGSGSGSGSASGSAPAAEACPAVVVHTSTEFGQMFVDTPTERVEPVIMEHLRRLYPELPAPVEVRCHRWRYSQVMTGYAGPQPFGDDIEAAAPSKGSLLESHGAAPAGKDAKDAHPTVAVALLATDEPPLVLAGDAFTASSFDGCVRSGEKVRSFRRSLFHVASLLCFVGCRFRPHAASHHIVLRLIPLSLLIPVAGR